jgi:mannosyl-oligosaccharide alpha-1,2-mannosidase
MDLQNKFQEAVDAVATFDFSITATQGTISVFENTIRYLGGLLAAYKFSEDDRLLEKAE